LFDLNFRIYLGVPVPIGNKIILRKYIQMLSLRNVICVLFVLLSGCGGGGGGGNALASSAAQAASSLLSTSSSSTASQAPALSLFVGNPYRLGNVDGKGALASFGVPEGIAIDSKGSLYVVDRGTSTIRKVTTDGVVTTFAGVNGVDGFSNGSVSDAKFNYPKGIAIDKLDNIYIAERGNNVIRKISSSGIVTVLAGKVGVLGYKDGVGTEANFRYPEGIAVDTDGNLYVADTYNSVIRKITPDGVVTTMAGLVNSPGFQDGDRESAQFLSPVDIVVDAQKNLFVADYGNRVVRKVTPNGVVTTLAGTPGVSGAVDGTGSAVKFKGPTGIALGIDGDLLVSDTNTLRKVTQAGVVTTLAGSADVVGSADGVGLAARFNGVGGIVQDSIGNIFIVDRGNYTIRKVTVDYGVTTIAGAAGSYGAKDGVGSNAQLLGPRAITVDKNGNLFITEIGAHAIRKITPGGVVTKLAGAGQGYKDGKVAEAQFNMPFGIVADVVGNLYVSDLSNHVIRKVSADGMVTTLAGTAGVAGSVDGMGGNAKFNSPQAIAIDNNGYLYVADENSHAVRKISPKGEVTTLAGSLGVAGSEDGLGSVARFSRPRGIAIDKRGNLYVSDSQNQTIRKITSDGVVTTLAGIVGELGIVDGQGNAAKFVYPHSLAIDENDNLYVAMGRMQEAQCCIIRKVTPQGEVSTVIGQPGKEGFVPGELPGVISDVYGVAIFDNKLYSIVNNAVIKVTPLP